MKLFLLACAGGALGAGLRYLLNVAATRIFVVPMPWATFAINVLGSLLMGAVIAYIYYRMQYATAVRIFIATGILGGFTTFSTFSLEALLLFERGNINLALLYISFSVASSIAACALGYFGVRALIS